jgi:hypothetical protein
LNQIVTGPAAVERLATATRTLAVTPAHFRRWCGCRLILDGLIIRAAVVRPLLRAEQPLLLRFVIAFPHLDAPAVVQPIGRMNIKAKTGGNDDGASAGAYLPTLLRLSVALPYLHASPVGVHVRCVHIEAQTAFVSDRARTGVVPPVLLRLAVATPNLNASAVARHVRRMHVETLPAFDL